MAFFITENVNSFLYLESQTSSCSYKTQNWRYNNTDSSEHAKETNWMPSMVAS